MKITCPTCNTNYHIPDEKIPMGKRASAVCKKCGGKIEIIKKAEEIESEDFKFETSEGERAKEAAVVDTTISPITPALGKMSVLWLIFLTLITFGIYFPIWFLRKREALNALNSDKKLGSGLYVFAIVVYVFTVLVAIVSGVMEGMGGEPSPLFQGLEALTNLINLVVGIILWVKCFTVRRILSDHFNKRLSALATFFLTIYYLQYRINRF
jgi:predicted Zn finger-like uncharacterized protein